MWMWLLLLNLAVSITASVTHSAEASLPKDGASPNPTTSITAKTMTVNNLENQAIFEGSVVLTQGELIVYSDHMVVSFRPGGNGNARNKSGGDTDVQSRKQAEKKQLVFLRLLYFGDLLDSPGFALSIIEAANRPGHIHGPDLLQQLCRLHGLQAY